jgi:hypothetical protein
VHLVVRPETDARLNFLGTPDTPPGVEVQRDCGLETLCDLSVVSTPLKIHFVPAFRRKVAAAR